jgi:hypothetical protein
LLSSACRTLPAVTLGVFVIRIMLIAMDLPGPRGTSSSSDWQRSWGVSSYSQVMLQGGVNAILAAAAMAAPNSIAMQMWQM